MPNLRSPRLYRVAVFYDTSPRRWSAYTLWYNPAWEGCCIHAVFGQTGNAAKALAIAQCKQHRPEARHA